MFSMYWKCSKALKQRWNINFKVNDFICARYRYEIIEMQMQDDVKARNIPVNAAIELNFVFVILNFSMGHIERKWRDPHMWCGVVCARHAFIHLHILWKFYVRTRDGGDSVVCVKSIFLLRVFFAPFVHFSLHFVVGNIIFTHGIGWIVHPKAIRKSGKRLKFTHWYWQWHNARESEWVRAEANDEFMHDGKSETELNANKRANERNTQWSDGVDAVNNILWRKDGSLMSTTERNKLNRKVWGAHIVERVCEFELVSTVHCTVVIV